MESGLMTGEQTPELSSQQIQPMNTEGKPTYGGEIKYKGLAVSQNPIEDLAKVDSVFIGYYTPCCACQRCGCDDCCKCECHCCQCCADIEFEFLVHAKVNENGTSTEKLLFTILQKSPCCQVNCLAAKFREMELTLGKVVSTSKAEIVQSYHQHKANVNCCNSCCFEPKIYMNHPQASPNPVLRGPSACQTCWEFIISAFDDQGQNLKYTLNGSCCQCATLCPCCCGMCFDFVYAINSGETKQQIGNTHILNRCHRKQGCCADHTNFIQINFPEGSSTEDKMKLIYASYYSAIVYATV